MIDKNYSNIHIEGILTTCGSGKSYEEGLIDAIKLSLDKRVMVHFKYRDDIFEINWMDVIRPVATQIEDYLNSYKEHGECKDEAVNLEDPDCIF